MSGASLFYWRGVVLLLFIPWPFALTVFVVRIHRGNGLGPWEKTGGGGSYFIAGPVVDPVAGRCEFFRRGIFFFFLFNPAYPLY